MADQLPRVLIPKQWVPNDETVQEPTHNNGPRISPTACTTRCDPVKGIHIGLYDKAEENG